jgi:hypothetical protein
MSKNQKYIEEYLKGLTEREEIAYTIAKKMLGTSFDEEKSIGFLKWAKEKNIELY